METSNNVKTRENLVDLWRREEILKSEAVIRGYLKVNREEFLPEIQRHLAYLDEDIKLDSSSVMLKTQTIIKILEEAKLEKGMNVLQIGSTTGYEEALLTHMGLNVDVIEPRLEHIQRASANIGTVYPDMVAPQYYRRLRDTNKLYDRIICFGTVSSMDQKIMDKIEEGILILSVGEKHLLMKLEIKDNDNPTMQFHGILWMPLIDDEIFS